MMGRMMKQRWREGNGTETRVRVSWYSLEGEERYNLSALRKINEVIRGDTVKVGNGSRPEFCNLRYCRNGKEGRKTEIGFRSARIRGDWPRSPLPNAPGTNLNRSEIFLLKGLRGRKGKVVGRDSLLLESGGCCTYLSPVSRLFPRVDPT